MVFADIIGGFATLFSDPYAIYFVVLAAFVGIVFGALPGLTAAAAIAMMLPILIAYNDEIGGLAGLAFLYVIDMVARLRLFYSIPQEPLPQQQPCKMGTP